MALINLNTFEKVSSPIYKKRKAPKKIELFGLVGQILMFQNHYKLPRVNVFNLRISRDFYFGFQF